jgi:nucleoside-diphosphate-sugar epimerase
MMRRVLITGGAGFLGEHLVEAFRREGTAVRLFDVAEPPSWAAGLDCARGDVRDEASVSAALLDVDAVVHAAFASPREPAGAIRSVNVEGMRNLCRAALAGGVRRVVLVSSTIVEQPRRVHPFSRSAPLSRLDLYRASRAEAEEILAEHASRGLSAAVVRPKTFLGPGRVSAFAILFEWIRLGRPVPVFGAGRNRYQMLDVRDMAEGIRLLVASTAGGMFPLGAREFGTVREDLQALIDHAGTGARLRLVPGPIARAAFRGMEIAGLVPPSEWHWKSARGEDSVVDASRAERELGWRPQRSNAQMLREAYDWYVAAVAAAGKARTTHPVPLAHRVLKALHWILPR